MTAHHEYKTWKAWTEADVEKLLTLRAKGLSFNQCATALNRSRDAVVVKLRNPHGTNLQAWTEEERNRLWELLDSGYDLREISVDLGRTYYSCRNKVRNGRHYVKANKDRADEARELGIGVRRDKEYADLCRAHGGFWAYSEKRTPRGHPIVCLPLLPPPVPA